MAKKDDENILDLKELLKDRLEEGRKLLKLIEESGNFEGVFGASKLEKRIKKEVAFLEKFTNINKKDLKKEYLLCSNLIQLGAIVNVVKSLENPPHRIFKAFKFNGNEDKLIIDIVTHDQSKWIKVIAKNPKSLDLNSMGGQQFGQKSIFDQADQLLQCANDNPNQFKVPSIQYSFYNGVGQNLAKKMANKGIIVQGNILPQKQLIYDENSDDESLCSDSISGDGGGDVESLTNLIITNDDNENALDKSTLNLDITAMVAFVSDLTNGHSNYTFQKSILTQQAIWERQRPVQPQLKALFDNSTRLICCSSAHEGFNNIIEVYAGPRERKRARELLNRIDVVEDSISDRIKSLPHVGKVKERPKAIFGTGDVYKCATVTANTGFVRAVRDQGVNLSVIIHESRVLIERKLNTATVLSIKDD